VLAHHPRSSETASIGRSFAGLFSQRACRGQSTNDQAALVPMIHAAQYHHPYGEVISIFGPVTAESELAAFIAKFAPEMQARIRGCRARLLARFPDAVQLVYDNYNFMVIGFGPTSRPSDAIFSLAAQRRGINLCFLQRGTELPDPAGLLRGTGKVVRNVPLNAAEDLERPEVQALIDAALTLAAVPMEASTGAATIIKSVSAKQRPRQ
jgi:hypothetical protein